MLKHILHHWFIPFLLLLLMVGRSVQAQTLNPDHKIGTVNGNYAFSYNQTPENLVEVIPAVATNPSGLTVFYQWEQCDAPAGTFTAISGATQSGYSSSAPLTKNMWYRRKTTVGSMTTYSNVVKLCLVSANWEDVNYIREHTVNITAQTDWKQIDQLAIGNKFQTTTYLDGLGRSVEQVSRETATPAQQGGLWGDVVKFSGYDSYGREPQKYLPYTTTTATGKYKPGAVSEQAGYYSSVYGETSAFASITFDNSPLNRAVNVKQPGTSWAAGNGSSISYDVNTSADNVQLFTADFTQGNPPINAGVYADKTLLKITYTDENGKKVTEYNDNSGKLILKKVQIDDNPGIAHSGWICTYNVYDDFGRLRFVLQPEAVKYLDANNWSFAGDNGTQVLNELCFQYYYDDKGRLIWKKSPGADPLMMLYDVRDRVVFTQDGNQRKLATPQWTANMYDELDRPLATALYNTAKTSDALQTDINNATATSNISVTMGAASISAAVTSLNPMSAVNLNDAATVSMLKYLYYDDYSFNTAKAFNTGYTNLSAYSTADNNVQPIAVDNRTLNMVTGSTTRILGTNTFLNATRYYDLEGNHIQVQEDNMKSGVDITTSQYHWDGRVLSVCNSHTTPGTGYSNFITLTKYNFDKIGRIASLQKQYGSNAFKTITGYDYDDMGRLKTRHLDPGYNNPTTGGSELEALSYSYNIHSQLTGINKDYALKTPTYNKWGHYFGMYLGYDNKDGTFANRQLNGQVTGTLWNTMGDDVQRKYDYTYDNADRLVNAAYNEQAHPGDGWSNAKMDFSVSGASGKITYDLNGNLLTMLQKGVAPGQNAPITVDDLRYTYNTLSNKLQSVTDQMTTTNLNGSFGDFKDGTNAAGTPDYVYDANGNVVVDLNKNVQSLNNGPAGSAGISYNFLDKPELIRIAGKGTIKIVYSADGRKLQRIYTPETGTATTTTYINAFVYQSTGGATDALSYINFEEGRLRVITPTSTSDGNNSLTENGNITLPNSQMGAYDYFIMDYQQNVRMILTEETHNATSTCTMETGSAATEEPVFGQSGTANEVQTTRTAKPTGWTNANLGSSVSKLGNMAGHNIGPNTLQKVMAGDVVNASTQYWYQAGTAGNNPNIVNTVVNSLVAAIAGGTAAGNLVKAGAAAISANLGALPAFASAVQPTGSGGNTPQAYLTMLFFDERFNLVGVADGGMQQQQVAPTVDANGALLAVGSKAPKNGYVYTYISNRSDQDVYFDNLKVGITTGNIIEENHYYAFGLKIAALSSKKLGDASEGQLKNGYLYQGAFNELDEDINWNDFALRNYDPQIGRFMQQDPFDEYPNPYTGMGNDPVNLIDPSGGIGIPCPGTSQLSLFFMKAGEVISNSSRLISLLDIGAGVANGATGIYNKTVQFNIINQQFVGNLTEQVGNGGGGGDPIVEISEGIKSFWNNAFMPAVRLTNTYVNPLTPIVELATGKSVESDFTQKKSRLNSGAEAAIMMLPLGKIESTAARILEEAMAKDLVRAGEKGAGKYFSAQEVKNLISTEEGAQFQVEAFKKVITGNNSQALEKLWSEQIVTVTHSGQTYILNGHNRLKALSELNMGLPKQAKLLQLSEKDATKMFKDKMEHIIKGDFKLKISQ